MNEINLEYFLEGESLFSRIQTLSPFPFFDQMTPVDMDTHLSMFYGERIIYPKLINLNLDQIASFIISLYSDKWNKLISINSIDFINGSEKTINETSTINKLDTGSNSKIHKVSAFNSDVLIDDYSDVDSNTNTTDNTGTKLLTEKTKSLQNAFNNLQLTQKLNIIETVVKDVSNYLTLDIY